jgi:hypothetical protein
VYTIGTRRCVLEARTRHVEYPTFCFTMLVRMRAESGRRLSDVYAPDIVYQTPGDPAGISSGECLVMNKAA